ncbi:hypothetical protein [Dysgonomonas sp. PFB1-18]|nr:hypothetical protein [Dysgonomonas sp. PFB1-18]
MDLQGFNKVVSSKTTVEEDISRTLPESNKRLGKASTFKDTFTLSEKTEYTYVNKGLSELNSSYSYRTIEPTRVIGAGMTTSVGEHKTTYTYTVPQKRSWLGNLWHKMTNFSLCIYNEINNIFIYLKSS